MKSKNKVTFTHSEVFLFGRCFGSDKVPESGNNPLGMENCHFSSTKVNLNQKAACITLANGDCLLTSTPLAQNRPKVSSDTIITNKIDNITKNVNNINCEMDKIDNMNKNIDNDNCEVDKIDSINKSIDCNNCEIDNLNKNIDNNNCEVNKVDIINKSIDYNNCEIDNINKTIGNNNCEVDNNDDNDRESVQSVLSIDYTSKTLQPLNPRQRIKCLREAGVDMVKDATWEEEGKGLVKLRQQRQQVGCKCTKGSQCAAGGCSCSGEGIPCQSDSDSRFPCKCGPLCGNSMGKKVYSHLRTKYHYRHTLQEAHRVETTISEGGACSICNDVSEETLRELFAVTVVPNRKRVAKSLTKNTKTKIRKSKNISPGTSSPTIVDIRASPVATVMTVVTSPLLPSYIPFPDCFDPADHCNNPLLAPRLKIDKENLRYSKMITRNNREMSIISLGGSRSTLSPIDNNNDPLFSSSTLFFNDYYCFTHDNNEIKSPTIIIDEENSENQLEIAKETYWSSFLNNDSINNNCCPLAELKPIVEEPLVTLNRISLAHEEEEEEEEGDNDDNNNNSLTMASPVEVSVEERHLCSPSLPYRLRQLTASRCGSRSYFESQRACGARLGKKKRVYKTSDVGLAKKISLAAEDAEEGVRGGAVSKQQQEEEEEQTVLCDTAAVEKSVDSINSGDHIIIDNDGEECHSRYGLPSLNTDS